MSSGFGSKRKARKIRVDDDDEGTLNHTSNNQEPLSPGKYLRPWSLDVLNVADCEKLADEIYLVTTVTASSSLGSKPFKKSSLRQSVVFDDFSQDVDQTSKEEILSSRTTVQPSEQTGTAPSHPKIKKKKPPSSRLSFGVGEVVSGDAAEALEDDESFLPIKSKSGRGANDSNALRKSLPLQRLPLRSSDEDAERPVYSKDYLNELKKITPKAPKAVESATPSFKDEQTLDISELAGATIVDEDGDLGTPATGDVAIPSEAEIREKKERRARLAHEKDYISLNDTDDGSQLSLLRKKKPETRLVRDDEDFAESFDEFVDDGRIALGKKQEREAKRRQRKEMEDLIQQAEGSSEEGSDSEAERRAAYEDAQTRAGMDGLHKPTESSGTSVTQIPSKITPIPALSECLERLQSTLSTMEQELSQRKQKMKELEEEKSNIALREKEVQDLLKEAGARYAALKAGSQPAVADPLIVGPENGAASYVTADRGLESFGNTPTTRPAVEDVVMNYGRGLLTASQRRSLRRLSLVLLLGLTVIGIIFRAPFGSDPHEFNINESYPSSDGYTKAFVVASVKKDDTSWIQKHVPGWKVFRYIVDNASAQLTVPKNKGREAMVYLTYLIDFYDNLPDITVFMHSDRYQWHNDDPLYDGVPMLKSLQIPYLISEGYANLRCVWTLGCPSELHPDSDKQIKDQTTIEDPKSAKTTEHAYPEAFAELFPSEELPSAVGVPCCAQFAVSRQQVHARPIQDYERYRQWLLNTTLEDQISGRILEYSWHMIFGKPNQHCPNAKDCYCNTYGLCNLACSEDGRCGERWPFPPYASLPNGWPTNGWKGEARDEESLAIMRNVSMVPLNEDKLGEAVPG
ncbi:hypothetical protein B7463_g7972, partial [Scytalidium lignicola]